MKSLNEQLLKLVTLCGTKDLTMWEEQFTRSMYALYLRDGESTRGMVEKIEQIYRKHFA